LYGEAIMKRQALETSEEELLARFYELREERLGSKVEYPASQKVLLVIVNKDGSSDGWRLE